MIRAMVVDDEDLAARYTCRLLRNLEVEVLAYYTNPYEAFENINMLKPDVLFLDIEMPEMSGLELAEKVYASGYECEVVFVTAYNEYAIEAFAVNAIDYLLKPISIKDINRSLERVKKRKTTILNNIIRNENKKIKVSLFGKISLYIGDEKKPIHWTTSKSAEIFAFMLLQKGGKEVSKWKLMDEIWPDKNTEKASINLRSTICRLNKTLRENFIKVSLTSTRNGYQLYTNDTDIEVDAFKLENLALAYTKINAENVQKYESIILSCRDMLLEEFSSEWCNVLRETYNRYFINVAHKLIQYYEEASVDSLKVLNIIEPIIAYNPYDEKIINYALRLHYKIGGKRDLQKYYKKYCDMLKNDLEIVPPEAIEELYNFILEK